LSGQCVPAQTSQRDSKYFRVYHHGIEARARQRNRLAIRGARYTDLENRRRDASAAAARAAP
jgi:hypothetical protein